MPSRTMERVSFLDRPSARLSCAGVERLIAELREVAGTCFEQIPEYHMLAADPDALRAGSLTLARDRAGRLIGFCAARRLHVDGVGDVLHLGLTCVRPDARGTRLTHRLLSALILQHALRSPVHGLWVSNVASVVSSLGNVALHFEDVYPSPFVAGPPTEVHKTIARTLAACHRDRVHIRRDAFFDPVRWVFEGGNADTIFAKRADDGRYHHRDPKVTRWFLARADLDRGDAVLQVGRVSLSGLIRYGLRSHGATVPVLGRWLRPRRLLGGFGAESA